MKLSWNVVIGSAAFAAFTGAGLVACGGEKSLTGGGAGQEGGVGDPEQDGDSQDGVGPGDLGGARDDGAGEPGGGALPGDAVSGWHRVGHRAVQSPAISDGAARPHSYFSVVAFDSGEVVPLNCWYHPQLFQYVPSTSALVSRAFMFPHEGMGNEDDVRWRIRAHKGPSAAESLVFWHDMGWEEITDENGSFARDAAVFSTRPIEESPGIMPRPQARVVNMGEDASSVGVGPYRAGIDYDPVHHILFASTDRTDRSVGHSLFQAFSVDTDTGQFLGRAIASAPGPTYRNAMTFLRVDPDHGLVLTQSENAWEQERPILYLTTYAPAAGDDVATFGGVQQLEASALEGPDVAVGDMPSEARDAVFVESDGHVWAVVAAAGLYVFDLGPVGGPYVLGAPVGRVPSSFRAEAIQRIGDELVVSSHGLQVYSTSSVLAVRGDGAPEVAVYRLPYPTYELDTATIEGQQTLFLASGPEGLDVFERSPMPQSHPDAGPLERDPSREIPVGDAAAQVLVETGHGLRTMGPPVTDADGDLAFWAVTEAGHEVIVLLRSGEGPTIIADTGRDPYRALGRPSLAAGGLVAFWAAGADGSQSILQWDGATSELAATDGQTVDLDQPELADTGAVLFASRDATGAGTLAVRDEDGALTTVFADDADWLVPSEDGEPTRQYDISPSGEVVFVKNRRGGHLVLAWWNGAEAIEVASDDREVNFPRMVVSGLAAYRSWSSEVINLRVLPGGPNGPGEPDTVADRHTPYQDQYFGNFQTAAALSGDDIVFIAQPYAPPSLELREIGNTLYRFAADDSLPCKVVGTDDPVDGATVRNVLFNDAATLEHGIAYVHELEHADGDVTYTLARLPL